MITPGTPHQHHHAVQFYTDEFSLSATVADFIAGGLTQDQPALVIATPEHRRTIESALATRGFDVARLRQLGDLIVLDARETLDAFMVDGLPHSRMFRHVLGSVFEDIYRLRPSCTVRAYGEMVDVLWKDGLTAAAIRLETLWNELAGSREFKLLCGYSMGNFYKGAALEEIKGQHTHVLEEVS